MCFILKILIISTLFHFSTSCLYVFLSRGMNMGWTRQMPLDTFWNQEDTDYFKTFSDIFDDGSSHKLALLKDYYVKEASAATCNLTVRIHNFNGQIETKTCDIISPSRTNGKREVSVEKVLFLTSNRVLVSWKVIHKKKGEHTIFKVIAVDNCTSSEFNDLKVATNTTHNIGRKFYEVIRLENTFDVIFENFKICPRGYCKQSFDYDGVTSSSGSLPFLDGFLGENETLFINSINTIETDVGIGVVLTGNKNRSPSNGRVRVQDIYSPILGWTKASDLFSEFIFVSNHQAYSNENGVATLCWKQLIKNKLSCKSLDDTRKTEHKLIDIFTSVVDHWTRMPWIYNTRDGEIIMINFGSENDERFIFIDKITIDGKCKRLMKIFTKNGSYPQYYLLTITDQNQFCFSFITWKSNDNENGYFHHLYSYGYEFTTQCIEVPNFSIEDDVACGAGYL